MSFLLSSGFLITIPFQVSQGNYAIIPGILGGWILLSIFHYKFIYKKYA